MRAACWLCSLLEVIRTGSYTILVIGYTDKELSYLKKCFSGFETAIEIRAASDAIFELPVKSMQYNCIVANPELLERLSYINLFRQLSQVPILLLSVEQCELSEAATLTVHCTKLRTDNTGKADQAEPMQKTPMTFIKIAELELCVEQRMAMIRGKSVNLTQKEFDLLLLFASNPKRVFTYEMIMDIVWHEDCTFYSRKAIHNHISNIKKKLCTVASEQQYIVSVHGVGYKFDVTQNNVMSFSYKTLFRLPRSMEKCLLYFDYDFVDATQTPGKLDTSQQKILCQQAQIWLKMLYSVFRFATLKLQLCNRFHLVFIPQKIFTKGDR